MATQSMSEKERIYEIIEKITDDQAHILLELIEERLEELEDIADSEEILEEMEREGGWITLEELEKELSFSR